ncbi:MAG TPA: TIR domain-containing protein [Burkholderiales bacterium]|nr:TIR domain-containing protein [Burkholderiales bacterium]
MSDAIPEIYVLWHPKCEVGETLARSVYGWLRPGNGRGPKVYYRSEPDPTGARGKLPLPLPGETGNPMPRAAGAAVANMHIALVLIDANMIADAAWRHWIEQLQAGAAAYAPCPRLVVPVALDATAFNVPPALRALNYVRPSGIPVPGRESDQRDAVLARVKRSLLKQLTELLCRVLLAPGRPANADSATAPKITVFLSHAKGDGKAPAQAIRDYIYSDTQLAAFYDENDIPYTEAFGPWLDANIMGTAAMIAIRSELYATRPWCRRELALFRRPRLEQNGGAAGRWRVNPLVVVDALEGGASTSGIAELGNAPIVRWSPTVPDQAEHVVTTLLREVFLASFHYAIAPKLDSEAAALALNVVPDPTTLLQIPAVRAGRVTRVYHPGHGLPGLEIAALHALLPGIRFDGFQQGRTPGAPGGAQSHRTTEVIGLSVSYQREHLLPRGFGVDHLRELLTRLGRELLRRSATLAYAGNWEERDDNFTLELLRLIASEQEDGSAAGGTPREVSRLYNHSSWPNYLKITPHIEAEWINACRTVRVTQAMAGIAAGRAVADGKAFHRTDRATLNTAIAVSAMRRISMAGIPAGAAPHEQDVPPIAARVLLGGKVSGFSGFLPGLFEEALVTLDADRPLYILGGFGGAAEVLAQAFTSAKLPAELSAAELKRATPQVAKLEELAYGAAVPEEMQTGHAIAALVEHVTKSRDGLAATLKTGLTDAETGELMTTFDMDRAIGLVLKGLENNDLIGPAS